MEHEHIYHKEYTEVICRTRDTKVPIAKAAFCTGEGANDKVKTHYEERGLATIISLYVSPSYRRKGYGTQIMKHVMRHLYKFGLRYAELDDASDYSGRSDCVYVKLGFRYDQGDNHMICNLRSACVSGRF